VYGPSAAYAPTPAVRYAGFWLRFLAYVIDSIVISLVVMAIAIPLILVLGLGAGLSGAGGDPNPAAIMALISLYFGFIIAAVVGQWMYFAYSESSTWQATLGKRLLGLRVTDLNGGRIGFGRATGRFFGKILSGMILNVGFIMAGFTEKKQALHDMLASTLVVRK
jgi:uncharacterized RDD family membrane protein YckC